MIDTLLSIQLRHKSVGDLIWLVCIGVTDAYTNNHLKIDSEIQNLVHHIFPTSKSIVWQNDSTFYTEDLYSNNNGGN